MEEIKEQWKTRYKDPWSSFRDQKSEKILTTE